MEENRLNLSHERGVVDSAVADQRYDLIASSRNAVARIVDREISRPDPSQGCRVTVQEPLRLSLVEASNHALQRALHRILS